MTPSERIFIALDTVDVAHAVSLARRLEGRVGGLKIGKEFFVANGPEGTLRLSELGMRIFLDLKFHDIPNTVANAIRASLRLRPFMINVHALGGQAMLRAAADAVAEAGEERPILVAVTILTSLGAEDLSTLGFAASVREQVRRFALLAKACGLDGVVCSSAEAMTLRGACGGDFKLVVPGVRPDWAPEDDHKRCVRPSDAIALGADYLVIGRPITAAPDPVEAADRIITEIGRLGSG